MNANVKRAEWVDEDDAPELDAAFFARAKRLVNGVEVSPAEFDAARKRMGRPRVESPKVPLTMRVDADVAAALKASGAGWQTRLNQLLRREILGESPPGSAGM